MRRFGAAQRFITTYSEEWHRGHEKPNFNGVCVGGPVRDKSTERRRLGHVTASVGFVIITLLDIDHKSFLAQDNYFDIAAKLYNNIRNPENEHCNAQRSIILATYGAAPFLSVPVHNRCTRMTRQMK